MTCNSIVLIVEGDGEVDALPIILRRYTSIKQAWEIQISKPTINAHSKYNLLNEGGLERFLKLALKRNSCKAILILIDADKECATILAKKLAKRCRIHNPHVASAVVVAKHMYENWFLANIEILKGQRGLKSNLMAVGDPERIRNPKKWITDNMVKGRAYRETTDQAAMSQLIDIKKTRESSRSFRRLLHAIDELIDSIYSGIPTITPA